MNKAYEYRIYPTQDQVSVFNKTLGLCRLYYNLVVENKTKDHGMPIEGYKPTFTKFKPEALEWIKEVDSMPLGLTCVVHTRTFLRQSRVSVRASQCSHPRSRARRTTRHRSGMLYRAMLPT